jgi:ketosteroid isomerase-like protein
MRKYMKPICIVALITLTITLSSFTANAQKRSAAPRVSLEQTIRNLDLAAAKAVLEHDEKGIARYFAANSVTNNPRNGLTKGSSGVIETAKAGLIEYYKFERSVESVQIIGNTAITMGQETITVKNQMNGPGAQYDRRYTNVWMRSGRTWQIVARHASNICGQ